MEKYRESRRELAIMLLIIIAFISCVTPISHNVSASGRGYDPVVIRPTSMLVTHNQAPTVVIRAEAGLSITVYKDDQVVGTGLGNGLEPAVIQLNPLGRGVHNLIAKTSLTVGEPLGETRLPKIVIDDSEPFDISDIVKFSSQLYDGNSPDSSFHTIFSDLIANVSPKEALVFPITAAAEPGTVAGTTRLNVTPPSSNLYVKVSSSPLSTLGMGSLLPSGATGYVSGNNISGVDAETNKYIGLYEKGERGVTGFALITLLPEHISKITLVGALTSVDLIRPSIGQFKVNIEPVIAKLTKEDFSVTVDTYETSVNTSDFVYHPANGSITLGQAVVDLYNRKPIKVTVAASATSSRISGSYTIPVLLGDIEGRVRTEMSEAGVSGITLFFREGSDNQTGPVIATAVTSENGMYTVSLDPGQYTVELQGPGYVTSFINRNLVLSELPDPINDFIAVNIPEGDNIRIVLTWGANPQDLDSHLIGPTPDGGSFHVNFSNPGYVYNRVEYASLDLDDTDGYGPETTTVIDSVYGSALGTYTFYVHQWTESTLNVDLLKSAGKVEVYRGNLLTPVYTYHVPDNGIGRYWNVFDMTFSESGVSFAETGVLTDIEPTLPGVPSIKALSYPTKP